MGLSDMIGAGLFVGRQRERGSLTRAIEAVATGRGRVVLLAGEPGIGKTTLAAVASDEARERGFAIAWGRVWEVGGAPPYWPWLEVARALDFDIPRVAPGSTEPSEARFAFFEAVLTSLRRVSANRPCAIILDDLHAADLSSLELLAFVARAVHSAPLLLIGTLRPVEARLSTAKDELLGRLARDSERLDLEPLGADEVRDLVRASNEDERALPAILEATEGNPLFVREAIRLVRGRSASNKPFSVLPDDVRGVLGARLALVDDSTLGVLEIAAVVGRSTSRGVLARVADGADLDAALETASRAGIVNLGELGSVRFTHVLLRDHLYTRLALERRRALHARIADVLASVGEHATATEIVHHRIAAGGHASPDALVASVEAAVHRALSVVAFEEARDLVARAEASSASLPKDATARLEILAAAVAFHAGDGEALRSRASRAFELARELGDAALLAKAALAWGADFSPGKIDGELVAALACALEATPPTEAVVRAELRARHAAATQPAPDPTVPIRAALEAVADVRPSGDRRALRAVLQSAGSALAAFGAPRERAQLNDEIVQLSLADGDKIQALRATLRLVFDHLELGDAVRAATHLETFAEVLSETRAPRLEWQLPMARAMLAIFEGRFEDAERHRADAARSRAMPTLLVALSAQRLWQLLVQGRYDEAHAHGRAALEAARGFKAAQIVIPGQLACADVRRGEADAALEALERARRLPAFATLGPALWGDVIAISGDRALIEASYARILPNAERAVGAEIVAMTLEPSPSRVLGLLAAALGRQAEAAQRFDYALSHLEAMGGVGLLRDLHADRARALGGRRPSPAPALTKVRAPATSASSRFELVLEGEVYRVTSDEGATRYKASQGMKLLARLIELEGREAHVLTLTAIEPSDAGDAGPMLDAKASADYRARLVDLRDAVLEASDFHDVAREAAARAELDALTAELARALGLGGRARVAGRAADRARVNVQRHVRGAIDRIRADHPSLARHLDWAVQTGTFCSYVRERARG